MSFESIRYTAETCPGRPCSTGCDHLVIIETPAPQVVYVVRFDHPDYSQGIDGVFRTRDAAVEVIRKSMRLEKFNPDTDLEESEEADNLTVYAGTGDAEGIYYYLHVEEVR